MGLASTGDAYCRRGDEAIRGLQNTEKVVDDTIIYDDHIDSHIKNVRNFLDRCRKHKITLNRDKFKFCQSEVKYVSFIINRQGISADPKKMEAISEFPTPKNITDLRSFMGLANQLGQFSSQLTEKMEPLRKLLKKKYVFK